MNIQRPISWRVRVKRTVEDWVDVIAMSAIEAEALAHRVPQVVHVFARSAIRGDKPLLDQRSPAGIIDDDGT